jgi:hypothetical protein
MTDRIGNKQVLALLLVLIASAFGPYVFADMGLRTEHFVIYPGVALLWVTSRWTLRWPVPIRVLFTALAAEVVWMVTVTFLRSLGGGIEAVDAPSFFRVLSHFENVTQPLAIIFLVVLVYQKYPESIGRALLDKVALAVIVFLSCNTVAAVASIFVDITSLIDPFYASSTAQQGSAWQNSMAAGRYTGIFNMPFVGGVAYSLGILLWGYRMRTAGEIRIIDLVFLGALVLGGVLGVSKVFIIGGALVFLVYLKPFKVIASRPKNALLVGAAAGILLLLGMPELERLDEIKTFDRIARYFEVGENEGNFLAVYTANRLVPGSSLVIPLFVEAWQEAPLWGFGLAASTLLDNGYLEAFYQGGFVALLAYLWALGTIFWQGLRLWRIGIEEGRLLIAIGVLLVGANLGAPATSVNRFSVLLWVVLTLLFIVGEKRFTARAGQNERNFDVRYGEAARP